MPSIDERIVQIKMENNQFEREAHNTMGTLSKLSDAFSRFGSSLEKDIDMSGIQKSINSVTFDPLQNGIDVSINHFGKLETMATDALLRIARKAEDVAVSVVKSLSVDQIMSGLSEYELKLDTIQVILANTQGTATLDEIKDKLEELNNYADKTIYNFGQMTQNIGRFTAAGVGLDESVTAITGLSNLSALVGANSEQNSRAMYNLSQSLSSGKMLLRDWMSFENAGGLGGKVFRDELIKTADELGYFGKSWETNAGKSITGADLMAEANKSFRDTLVYGWVDNTVLINTLSKFADESTDLGKQAYEAATSVRTFTKLMDALKESVQSGWAESWEIIVGDYEAAPKMWNKVNEVVGGFLEKQTEARNADLEAWANDGGREKVINGISNAYETLTIVLSRLAETFDKVFDISRLDILNDFSSGFESVTGNILHWVKTADSALSSVKDYTKDLKAPGSDKKDGSFEQAKEETNALRKIQKDLSHAYSNHTADQLGQDIRSMQKYNKAATKLNKSANKLSDVLDNIFKTNYSDDDRLKALEEAIHGDDTFADADLRKSFESLLTGGTQDLKKFSDQELKIFGYTSGQIEKLRSDYSGPGYKDASGSADELRSEQKEIREIIREEKKEQEEEAGSLGENLSVYAKMAKSFFSNFEEVMSIVHELWDDFLKLKDVAVEVVKDVIQGFYFGVNGEEFTNVAHNIVHRITDVVNAVQQFVSQPEIRDKIVEISSGFFSFFGILMKFKMAKWQVMISIFQYLITNVGPAVVDAFHKIARAFNELNSELGVTNIINEVAGAISGFFDDSETAKGIAGVISAAINLIADGIVWLIHRIRDLVDIVSKIDATPILDFIRNLDFSKITEWFKGLNLEEISKKFNEKGVLGILWDFVKSIKDFFTKDLFAGIAGKDGSFGLIDKIQTGITNLKNFFSGITWKDVWKGFTELFTGTKVSAAELDNPYAVSPNPYANVKEQIDESLSEDNLTKGPLSVLSSAFDTIKNFIKDRTSNVIVTFFDTVVITGALMIFKAFHSFSKALKIFGNIGETLSKTLEAPGKFLGNLSQSIDKYARGVKFNETAEGLLKLAGAVGIFAGSMFLLSKINAEDMNRAFNYLLDVAIVAGTFTTALAFIMNLLNSNSGKASNDNKGLIGQFLDGVFGDSVDEFVNDPTRKFKNIGIGIAAIAGSFIALIAAFKLFSKVNNGELLRGSLIIAGFLTAVTVFSAAVNKFGNSNLLNIGAGVALIAAAINLLVVPIAAIGLVTKYLNGWEGVGAILVLVGGLVVILGAFSAFNKAFGGDSFASLGVGIMLIAAAINLLVVPVAALGLVMKYLNGWAGVGAIVVLMAAMVALAGAFSLINKKLGGVSLLSIAVGVVALAGSLTLLAIPIAILGPLCRKHWQGLLVMAGALAALILAAKSNVLNAATIAGLLKFAGALIIVAAGIAALGAAIRYFTGHSLTEPLVGTTDVFAAEMDDIVDASNISDELEKSSKENKSALLDGVSGLGSDLSNALGSGLSEGKDGLLSGLSDMKDSFGDIDLTGEVSGLKDSITGGFSGLDTDLGETANGALSNFTGAFSGLNLSGFGDMAMSPFNSELGSWGSILGLTSEGNVDSIITSLGDSIQSNIPTIQEQGTSIFDALINGISGEGSSSARTTWQDIEADPLQGIGMSNGYIRGVNPDHYSNAGKAIYAGLKEGFYESAGEEKYGFIRVWLDEQGNLLDYHPEIDAEIESFDLSTSGSTGGKSLFDNIGEMLKNKVTTSVEGAGGIPGILSSLLDTGDENGWGGIGTKIQGFFTESIDKAGGVPGILGALLGTEGENGWDGIGLKLKDLFTDTVEEAGGIKGIFGALIGTEEGGDPWEALRLELVKKTLQIGTDIGDSLKKGFSESVGSFFANIYTSIRQWLNNDDTYSVVFNADTGMFEEVFNTDAIIEYQELLDMFANNSPGQFQAAASFAKQQGVEISEVVDMLERDLDAYKKGAKLLNEGPSFGQGFRDLFSWIGNLFTPEAHAAELTPEERAQIYTEPVQQVVDSVNENTKDIILKAETNSTQNSEDLGKALQLPPAPVDPNTVSQEFIGPIQQTKDAVMTGVDGVIEEAQAEKEAKVGQLADALTIKVVDVFAESGSDVAESASGVTDSIADTMTTEADTAMPEAANGILSKLSTNIKNYISSHMPSASIDVITSLVDKMKDKMTEDAPGTSEHIVGTLADNIKTKAGEQAPPAGMEISGQVISGAIKYADENSGNVGASIVNGVINSALSQDNITALINAGKSIGTTLLNATNTALAIASPSKEFGKVADYSVLGLVKRVEDNLSVVSDAGSEIGGSFLTAYQDMMDRINTAMNSDVTPTVSPILDLSGLQNDVSRIDGMFSRDNLAMANDINYSFNERQSAFLDSRNYPTPINYREDLYSLHNDLASLSSLMSNLQVVLDTGSLVGGMRQQLNTSLGATAARRIRGL